jgi:hypothetical protein
MIAVVITIIVIVLYRMDKRYKQDIKRINELEEMLDRYYKEREYKLKSIKEFYEIGCGREGCKDTTPHIH